MAAPTDYHTVAHKRGLNPQVHEVTVQDDGEGYYLHHWAPRLGAEPSEAELAAVTQTDRDAAARDQLTGPEMAMLAMLYHETHAGAWPPPADRQRLRADYIEALKFVRGLTGGG